ncbi:MAG: hypothetical protein JWM16_1762 [Verrucomicrobiales bacterium]|nr:hypothetical protein [Verrucomicrobiales bacterium]
MYWFIRGKMWLNSGCKNEKNGKWINRRFLCPGKGGRPSL